jgi:hypothetical protein
MRETGVAQSVWWQVYELDVWGSISNIGRNFPSLPPSPDQLWGTFPLGKADGNETDHSPI